jgi:hypothetical protein
MAKLQYLIIHCTDTPAGREISSAVIRQWHLVERGWKQVGYSDMIHINGGIESLVDNNNDDTVDPWEITNGVAGKNAVSRHIVYVGGKGGDTRTIAQKGAMMAFVREFVKKHPGVKVAGHYQFAANKTCPSFDVPQWLRSIGIPELNIYQP